MRRFIFALIAMVLVASSSLNWLAVDAPIAAERNAPFAGMAVSPLSDGSVEAGDHSGSCCDREAMDARHGASHCKADCGMPLAEFSFAFPTIISKGARSDIYTGGPTIPDAVFRPPIG